MATERAAATVIDAYASMPHYRAHLAPVFDALGELRGEWSPHGQGPVIVASYPDMLRVGERPVIMMEHGAGQTYSGRHPSYAGGRNRERVVLFLCPSERVAKLNRAAYPDTPSVVVGCPRLDSLERSGPEDVIGLAWHFNAQVCPESTSALLHYADGLGALAEQFPLIGTAHPRIEAVARAVYAKARIGYVTDIFEKASVLICDNSSVGWEFLATGRPVIWANAPWYRKEVSHGLRFWDEAAIQVDRCEEIPEAILRAVAEPQEARGAIARRVYEHQGEATTRAVAAIRERLDGVLALAHEDRDDSLPHP